MKPAHHILALAAMLGVSMPGSNSPKVERVRNQYDDEAIAKAAAKRERKANRITVVCAWCKNTISHGRKLKSHGICERCAKENLESPTKGTP